MSPFGKGLGQELLKSARSDSGSGGMVIFARQCRPANPNGKTYSPSEFNQFQAGLIDAYVEWRQDGYSVE